MSEKIVLTFPSKGDGGTSNYNALVNKPKINGLELTGELTGADLSLQNLLIAGENITIEDNDDGTATISSEGGGNAKALIATYNQTTAQEIMAYLETEGDFAPVLVKRGSDYYTSISVAKKDSESVYIKTFGSLQGKYYIFTYTITEAVWATATYGLAGETEIDKLYQMMIAALDSKQDLLTAGDNIVISPSNVIHVTGVPTYQDLADALETKQDTLESGVNIKTINNQSLLGSGNLDLHDAFVAVYGTTTYADVVAAIDANKAIVVDFANNHNLFTVTYSTYGAAGSDVLMYAIYKSGNDATLATITVTSANAWSITHDNLQEELVSGTSIKTVNNQSLLGSGNLDIGGGGSDTVILTYGETEYSVVKDAIDNNKRIVVKLGSYYYPVAMYGIDESSGNIFIAQLCSVQSAVGRLGQRIIAFSVNSNTNVWNIKNTSVQEELQSGTNLKTVNGQSLLGGGNIDIPSGGTVDTVMSDTSENAVQNKVIKAYVDGATGDLATLTTDDKTNLVAAINEVYEKSGEPFRVKNWATNALDVTIVPCTSDAGNTSLAKMVYAIDDVEGADYKIVGMIAYEVFDAASGGNRINCWPVCQFTGNGQKELSVRWMCGGTTNKVAKRINAWVLLKHR